MTTARKTIALILLIVSIFITNCSTNKSVSPKSSVEKEVTLQQKVKTTAPNDSKKDTVSKIQIEQSKKDSKKYYFKWYSTDSEKKKYVKIVWNWMLKDAFDGKYDLKKLQEMSPSTFNPKGKRAFIFADFNNDKVEDFLVIPCGGFYCSSGPHGCSTYMFLGPDYSEVLNMAQLFMHEDPIYISNRSTDGFKNLIVNKMFLHKYNKKQERYEIINYSRAKLKKNSKKYHFKSYSIDSDKGKVTEKISRTFNKDIPIDELIFAYLNDDKKYDIIAILKENDDYKCAYIFLGSEFKEPIRIALNMNGDNIDPDLPVYVLDTSKRGLKDILINEKYLCESEKIFVDSESYKCFGIAE